ncbi:MAG: trimeric intracellular cation channel family protein [Blastomonas sp.]
MSLLPGPSLIEIGPILGTLDLFGTAVFAATGALAAARKGQTLVTFAFFALITGVGGGTVRDLLIDAPVFWVHGPEPIFVVFGVVLAIWMTPERWWHGSTLDWLDAAGLAAYGVFGAAKALEYGVEPLPAAIMGIITACVGGIIRDVLAGVPSIILRPELYVTAAALAAGLFVALRMADVANPVAAFAAALAGFALRGAAIYWNIGLPTYRGRKSGGEDAPD